MRTIEWRYFQRPWTPNHQQPTHFVHFATPFIFP